MYYCHRYRSKNYHNRLGLKCFIGVVIIDCSSLLNVRNFVLICIFHTHFMCDGINGIHPQAIDKLRNAVCKVFKRLYNSDMVKTLVGKVFKMLNALHAQLEFIRT